MGSKRFIMKNGKFIDPRQEKRQVERYQRLKFKLTNRSQDGNIGVVKLSKFFQESEHVEKTKNEERKKSIDY